MSASGDTIDKKADPLRVQRMVVAMLCISIGREGAGGEGLRGTHDTYACSAWSWQCFALVSDGKGREVRDACIHTPALFATHFQTLFRSFFELELRVR